VKELLKCLLDFGAALRRRVALFGKQIAIPLRLVCAIAVARHAGNLPQGGIDVLRRRGWRRLCVRKTGQRQKASGANEIRMKTIRQADNL
jgi:hypothetical protein